LYPAEDVVSDPLDPPSLKELLFETVDGFEELETLAWFHEHGEGAVADAGMLAKHTSVLPEDAAATALNALAVRGILSSAADRPGSFTYTPTPDARRVIDYIVREYRANTLQVMKYLTANAIERVRTGALRAFADSFRIKRPKRNG
jgi:hypothetical protein